MEIKDGQYEVGKTYYAKLLHGMASGMGRWKTTELCLYGEVKDTKAAK
jgi:hypothetical protein